MPRLRAEQLQSLTLTDMQISDGFRYDATGAQIGEFDSSRLIDQSKIRGIQHQPNGWISRGIINKVEVLPEWVADYEGRLFYVNTSDQLFLGVGTDPWYILISGDSGSGWDAELTVRTGMDGLNWNGSIATQFNTISYSFSPDGSDLFVYMNGSLMRKDHDFELVDQRTIRMLRNIEQNDTVTLMVILSNSLLNYATKSWVYDQIQSGGLQHSLNAAYNDGAIVSVDNRDVDWRLATDNKFIVSQASTSIPLPASNLGNKALPTGHNWQSRWQSFDITMQNGGNTFGPKKVILNSPTVTPQEVAVEVSESLVTAGLSGLFGYMDSDKIGIQSSSVGSDISFTISSTSNALPTFGLNEQIVQGDDAYPSYHNFGLNVDAQNTTSLRNNEIFWFKVNGVEHSVSTGVDTTYNQLRASLDSILTSFDVTTVGSGASQDIRVTNKIAGLANTTTLEPQSYAGQIEITQVTTIADIERNLSSKYFELSAIDSALFGKEKKYYTWYHLGAEAEVSEISCTSENSNVTLADKYFTLHSPSEDYYVWYEVETPQTSGYQELGLNGVTTSTDSGLSAATPYYFKVARNGAPAEEYNFVTPSDIQPTEEITKVTTVGDSSQSLSGKFWTLNSKAGTGYYVWYNINTSAAPEITEITTVGDNSQSLSGKKFKIFSPDQEYYAWFSMMTNPGQAQLAEVTKIDVVGDSSQSLSGKYFNIDSADGSKHYVWYEMVTDPGVVAKTEITEITTMANTNNNLSGKYFNISTTGTNYYVWYRTQIAEPIAGAAEVTNVIMPSDSDKSLSGKYWTFNTPYNEYYVWYRMEDVAAQPATKQETTISFVSETPADYDYDTTSHKARIYNFEQAFDIVWTTTGTADTSGLSNPVIVNISSATNATDIATATAAAVGALSAFDTSYTSDTAIITNAFVGTQLNNPSQTGSNITVMITEVGTDYVPGVYSPNPAPAGKTGIQINITANDVNTVVASLTNSQLALLSDITTEVSGSTITITNNDNGSVVNAADVDAGVVPNIVTEGVTSMPAEYSVNPAPAGKTGIVVNIEDNDTAAIVATLTYDVLNAMPQFNVIRDVNKLTIETTLAGSTPDADSGDSGFSVSTIQQGLNYIAPTYSTNPAPGGRSPIKVVINENATALAVAEATRAALDSNISFIATRVDGSITVTGTTLGPVDDAYDVNTSFTIVITQNGQDYIAPEYTTNPGGTGIGIEVSISENATDVVVAQAIETSLPSEVFTISRVGNVLTITNVQAGVANNSIDVDTNFTIIAVQEGYEAYSSLNPNVPARTGIKVDIIENDSAELVAAKTAVLVNNAYFTASASEDEITIIDKNSGAVADANSGTTGFNIIIENQGTDLIPGDVSWGQIITLLNTSISGALWAITGGDVRLTANSIGSQSSIVMSSGTVGNDLFANINGFINLEASVIGTSNYSAMPSGSGIPIKVELLNGVNANIVAQATRNAINTLPDFTVMVDMNVLTITNVDNGIVNDISNFGTDFNFIVINQGANESVDPTIAGKIGIRVDINKNDSAINIATKTASAIDVGGEFYVTRLNNIISIQNDFPGMVTPTTDVNTNFVITKTGNGEDVKYSLFGSNGLNITLPAPVLGINAKPAIIPVGTASLTGGFNFYTFPKDFAVIINNEPIIEIFLNQAVYNSSEAVSHINNRIAAAGSNNFEAYQDTGRIGFRTIQTGLNQTISLKNSLSDALATLGWTPGTYSGDFGSADSIFQIEAISGQNEITVNANILPGEHGVSSIGASDNKFKEIWVQDGHFDAGTIYIGNARISEEDGFTFMVDDGINQYEFFGNSNPSIAPTGASHIGVAGVIGVIPDRVGAQPGDAGTLQEMMVGFAKSAGGGKVFPDMSSTGTYGDPTNLKGFLKEKQNGLYLKLNEIVYIKSLGRNVIVKATGTGVVRGTDWDFVDDTTSAIGADSVKFDLTPIDVNGDKTAGTLGQESFYVKTTGGIKLETGGSAEVQVTNDLRVMGDLIVDGDSVTLNVSELKVEDNIITLNKNWTGAPVMNAGIEIERGSSVDAKLIWDEQNDLWRAGLEAAEKAIALRNDTQTNNAIPIWNNTTSMFDTTSVTISGSTITGSLNGNASTATTLQNARTINGVSFNGSANITITATPDAHNQAWSTITSTPTSNSGYGIADGIITSGNGMASWTATNGNLTIALGTPTALTSATTDATTATSHTHSITTVAPSSTSAGIMLASGVKASGHFYGGTTAPTATTRLNYDGDFYATKVYNAMWNDIADFITVESECIVEAGKCYFITPDFRHMQTTEICQKGVLGIASDTYGYGLGKDENKNQLPVAIGGFVLAYVDGEVEPGDALTCGPYGNLVIITDEMKSKYPERIVATYYKPESSIEYNGIMVDGRHWVKVK